MRSKLHYAILGGCVAALLIISLSGCTTTAPAPTPPANWYWEFLFDTGDGCNSKTVELPRDGTVSVEFNGNNLLWGNVPKMWIYLNGKQVAYDVGRNTKTKWEGKVKTGDNLTFKGCAETHGDSAGVAAYVWYQ